MTSFHEGSPIPGLFEANTKEAFTEYGNSYLKLLTSRGLTTETVKSMGLAGYEVVMNIDAHNVLLPNNLHQQIGEIYGSGIIL